MARDKKTMIGFDPLAWLDEEAEKKSVPKKKAGKKSEQKSDKKSDRQVEKLEQPDSPDITETIANDKVTDSHYALQENIELSSLPEAGNELASELSENERVNGADADQESTPAAPQHKVDNNEPIESSQSILRLHSIQDIGKSQMLKNDMLALIYNSDEISIEASTVERIDGSALQLLCALFQYSKNNNLAIHWLSPSQAVLDSVEVLGIKQLLELN